MGMLLGGLGCGGCMAQLGCCFCGKACACYNCPGECRASTTTRVMYVVLLTVGMLVSSLFLTRGVQRHLVEVKWFCGKTGVGVECQRASGYQAVYRISFSFIIFFFLMAVIMIRVENSKNFRAKIQNGFWFFKILGISVLCAAAFFLLDRNFPPTWMYMGLTGSAIFIVLQMFLIVSFVERWAEKWLEKWEKNRSVWWQWALLTSTVVFFLLAVAAITLLFLFYTKSGDCSRNKVFISINVAGCFFAMFLSATPKIQENLPGSGLFHGSAVSVYIVFVTWLAVTSDPRKSCNPSLHEAFISRYKFPGGNNSGHPHGTGSAAYPDPVQTFISTLIWFGSLLYSAIAAPAIPFPKRKRQEGSISASVTEDGDEEEIDKCRDDEQTGVQYSYTWLHALFGFASLYMMMTLTSWYKPSVGTTIERLDNNEASVWVKIISSWVCLFLYCWTLLAPTILPETDLE